MNQKIQTLVDITNKSNEQLRAVTEATGITHRRVESFQSHVTRVTTGTAPMYPSLDTYGPSGHQPVAHATRQGQESEKEKAPARKMRF